MQRWVENGRECFIRWGKMEQVIDIREMSSNAGSTIMSNIY